MSSFNKIIYNLNIIFNNQINLSFMRLLLGPFHHLFIKHVIKQFLLILQQFYFHHDSVFLVKIFDYIFILTQMYILLNLLSHYHAKHLQIFFHQANILLLFRLSIHSKNYQQNIFHLDKLIFLIPKFYPISFLLHIYFLLIHLLLLYHQ